MNEELNPTEDQMIDALLAETLGNCGPPDQTDRILARFHGATDAPVVRSYERKTGNPSKSKRSYLAVTLSTAAVLAASFLAIAWLRSDDTIRSTSINTPQLAVPDRLPVESSVHVTSNDAQRIEDAPTEKRVRGIPRMIGANDSAPLDDSQEEGIHHESPSQSPAAIRLVSHRIESDLRAYWDTIGTQPTGDASPAEIAARLRFSLGVDLSGVRLDDAQRVQKVLRQPEIASAIAASWLDQISEHGLSHVDAEAKQLLIEELAACFQSPTAFDRLLVSWINGRSDRSSAFFEAIGFRGRHPGGEVTQRLAALTMNVDLRCTECHDSYIRGDGRQEAYWAFAALLHRGQALFYELPDGRQRVAEPSVPASWMKSPQPLTTMRQWSESLMGSQSLAHGVVNSLWQLVHRRPLSGRVVDPISAPHGHFLDRLETHLSEDLIASDFDVARTLAVIIASPVTRRSIPESLLPENALVATESERSSAMNSVDAFAATMPVHSRISLQDRLDESMRAIGAKLGTDGQDFVGQVGGSSVGSNQNKSKFKSLSADFPGSAETLPVQWLGTIKDKHHQINHLGYLAGVRKIPTNVMEASDAMERSSISDELRLHRIWWMIRKR